MLYRAQKCIYLPAEAQPKTCVILQASAILCQIKWYYNDIWINFHICVVYYYIGGIGISQTLASFSPKP